MADQQTIQKVNGIEMNVLQRTVQAIEQDPALGMCRFRARNRWRGGTRNRTTVTDFFAAKEERTHRRSYTLDADEPPLLAGGDEAPNPVEHLLHALAGCVTTGVVAHAAVRGIPIEELESELEGDIDLRGFLGLAEDVPKGFTNIRMTLRVKTDVDNMERLKRLTEYSPVLSTLTQRTKVDIEIRPK